MPWKPSTAIAVTGPYVPVGCCPNQPICRSRAWSSRTFLPSWPRARTTGPGSGGAGGGGVLVRGRAGGVDGTSGVFDCGNSARDTGDFIFFRGDSLGVGEELSEDERAVGDFSLLPVVSTACAVHPHARARATTAPAAARPLAIASLLIASPTPLHRTSLPEVFPMSEWL
ncbi:hypothetical protein GCM10010349_14440 [Streptomyces flavofungini]|nr:hypothetical protein GCM10010349_14440 [Streptomyces flavofungini]